jgi:hypothetical protein
MFSREEKKELNTLFFQQFNRHMSSHNIVGGGGKNWDAYKTGIKGLYFRILTQPKVALAIDLQFKDEAIRELVYDQFGELTRLLASEWKEEPKFEKNSVYMSGEPISRISVSHDQVYFYNQEQWPEIMEWLELKLIGLDSFWDTAGDILKELVR